MEPNLTVDLGNGLVLKNPVLTASGTFGYGYEFADFFPLKTLGGFIVKGTTLHPRQGNDYPRMAETPAGMLNAVGLQNKGVEFFKDNIYPGISDAGTNLIVNISANTPEDYARTAEILSECPGVAAVEVNISCPNVKQGGMAFGTTCTGAAAVTKAVRSVWRNHMIVKLSPNVADITEIAKAVEAEGADSVSLINTLLGMAVDVDRRRAALSTVTGGLSGPAVRPVAVRMVWQTAKAVGIPVVGLGGITCARDALEFIMAGASAVQIGTASFVDPATAAKVVVGIKDWCAKNSVSSIDEIRGII